MTGKEGKTVVWPFYINDVHQSCPHCDGKLFMSININSTHGYIICDGERHYLGHYKLDPEVIKEVFNGQFHM